MNFREAADYSILSYTHSEDGRVGQIVVQAGSTLYWRGRFEGRSHRGRPPTSDFHSIEIIKHFEIKN